MASDLPPLGHLIVHAVSLEDPEQDFRLAAFLNWLTRDIARAERP